MKLINTGVFLSLIFIPSSFAASLNCSNMITQSDGAKVCNYSASYAVSYSLNNWDQSEYKNTNGSVNDGYFESYLNNCTNFVSQSILAGFSRQTSRKKLFDIKERYLADKGEHYSWFYKSKWDTGNSWKEAHSLYLYAKYTSDYDDTAPYNESGPKFKFITEDSLTHYMAYQKVQVGDIIFMDHTNNDGHMDHVLIVTDIEGWRYGYNEIRVASNTSDYPDKGLGDINEAYDKKATFHVFRPLAYVEQK